MTGKGTDRGARPVMHDVARLAGVSHQTVSRVLNGHPHVGSTTRARVVRGDERAELPAERLGSRPGTQRSQRIGVLSFDSRLFGPGSTLHAIERAARAAGFGVAVAGWLDRAAVMSTTRWRRWTRRRSTGSSSSRRTTTRSRALGDAARAVPAVAVEAGYRDQPVVAIDQREGARLATRHLLDLGHRTVWHLAGPQDWLEAALPDRGLAGDALGGAGATGAAAAVRRLERPLRVRRPGSGWPRGPT